MSKTTGKDMTRILGQSACGNASATAALFTLVYDELRALAAAYVRQEPAGITLQATALVHEAYIKLVGEEDVVWKDRTHFFRLAARAMREFLVDHARAKRAGKRGGGWERVTLGEAVTESSTLEADELLAIHDALASLAEDEPKQVQIVELRFFSGMTVRETAEILGMPLSTANDEWHYARAWLHRELFGERSG